MEFHTVLRDSEWIFIIEPEHLQFEHEHATGSGALQVWSQRPNWKRRRRRSEGFHRFEPEEERESEIALPVKIQSQGSKETVQILKQDSGNTQAPSYFTKNHHKSRTMWIHNQFELFGPKTLTLTQKNLKNQRKASESTTSVDRSISSSFYSVFIQKTRKIRTVWTGIKHEDLRRFNG